MSFKNSLYFAVISVPLVQWESLDELSIASYWSSKLRWSITDAKYWRHGTAFPLCAITGSIAAFPSTRGTTAKNPHSVMVLASHFSSGLWRQVTISSTYYFLAEERPGNETSSHFCLWQYTDPTAFQLQRTWAPKSVSYTGLLFQIWQYLPFLLKVPGYNTSSG
jgi:hypothetical protein